jgi:hypothetical protein
MVALRNLFRSAVACSTVQSTSIGLSLTSQITEYYGILRWITVTMDYSRLCWIKANLELRNNYGVMTA